MSQAHAMTSAGAHTKCSLICDPSTAKHLNDHDENV
jgi:hypothetical protein